MPSRVCSTAMQKGPDYMDRVPTVYHRRSKLLKGIKNQNPYCIMIESLE